MQTTFAMASPGLPAPREMTGCPIVEVYISSESPHRDVDLFAYLVCYRGGPGGEGATRYLTEGCLKASHRSQSRDETPPPRGGGSAGRRGEEWSRPRGWVPYHSHTRRDRKYLPEPQSEGQGGGEGEAVAAVSAPVLLRFALLPTSVRLMAGDRLGLLFTGCDLKHFLVEFKEYPFTIHTGAAHPTRLLLPPSPSNAEDASTTSCTKNALVGGGEGGGRETGTRSTRLTNGRCFCGAGQCACGALAIGFYRAARVRICPARYGWDYCYISMILVLAAAR